MPSPKFWRVLVKRAQKAHLTRFVAEEGSIALCGKSLPQDEHRRAAETVLVPRGDECHTCPLFAGYKVEKIRRGPRRKEQATNEELRLKALTKLANLVSTWHISDEQKRSAIEAIVKALPRTGTH